VHHSLFQGQMGGTGQLRLDVWDFRFQGDLASSPMAISKLEIAGVESWS
jgi:hypothetical protein